MSERSDKETQDSDETDQCKSPEQSDSFVDGMLEKLTDYITKVDDQAAKDRIQRLREKRPDATTEQLVEDLIQSKCIKTGSVGAVTSGTALIPGLGTLAALTFGMAADISLTFRMQTELVLEIAVAHEHELSADDKQRIILLVTGSTAGTHRVLTQTGTKISQEATERLAQRSVAKAIPVIGVAASAGVNVLSTYVIGRRAHTYFALGEDEMSSWSESVRAISGVDERKIATWLSDATWRSWTLINSGVKGAKSALSSHDQSPSQLLIDAGHGLVRWGKWAGEAVWEAGEKMSDHLPWWRRDGHADPPFPSDGPQVIPAIESPSVPLPLQVVAVVGLNHQSPDEAQAQLLEAHRTLEHNPDAEPDIFGFLRLRDGLKTEDEEESASDLAAEESDDDELWVFSPRSWFRHDEDDTSDDTGRTDT